jgi:hypothetical protein
VQTTVAFWTVAAELLLPFQHVGFCGRISRSAWGRYNGPCADNLVLRRGARRACPRCRQKRDKCGPLRGPLQLSPSSALASSAGGTVEVVWLRSRAPSPRSLVAVGAPAETAPAADDEPTWGVTRTSATAKRSSGSSGSPGLSSASLEEVGGLSTCRRPGRPRPNAH